MTASEGAHLVAWTQTRVDSRRPGPVADLRPGVIWDWRGRAIPVPALRDEDDARLLQTIRRVLPAARFREGLDGERPVLDRRFRLVHATAVFEAVLVELLELARPMILFRDGLPPQGDPLRVVAWEDPVLPAAPAAGAPAAIPAAIPLTPTRIRV
jgi:hypothetical protein